MISPKARPAWGAAAPLAWLLASAMIGGCKTDPPLRGSLAFTVGQEKDSWTRSPSPTRILVKALSSAGDEQTLADQRWPLDTIDLGTLPASGTFSFSVELDDDHGAGVLRGGTPFVGAGDLSGGELPVFCGRTGEFARPSAGLTSGWSAPRAVFVLGRYAFVGGAARGGSALDSELYDFATLSPLPRQRALPRSPRAIASADGRHVLLLDAGGASLLDLLDGSSAELPAAQPADLTDALDLMGGDGNAYLVGAARPSSDSAAVLRLDPRGALVRFDLTTARRGAAAAWVPMTGLVVLGGELDAPLEVLAPLSSAFRALGGVFPAANGAVALAFRPGELLLLGGADGAGQALATRRVSLACAPDCPAPATVGAPVPMRGGRALALSAALQLVVGEDPSTTTVAYLVSDDGATVTVAEITPRTARKGAAAVAIGGGSVALVGGVDASGAPVADVEVFTPP